MELTGKAKEDFKKWFIKTKDLYDSYKNELRLMSDTCLNALIIEWFDSVGIYIDTEFFRKNIKDEPQFVSSTTDSWNGLQPLRIQFNTRQEATEQAIIKANEIYNAKTS